MYTPAADAAAVATAMTVDATVAADTTASVKADADVTKIDEDGGSHT